jgi:hypothetical protein
VGFTWLLILIAYDISVGPPSAFVLNDVLSASTKKYYNEQSKTTSW